MARKPSPHTRYRHLRTRLADLEAARATLERTRPRTRGKRAAKTRTLNKLARQISAAKGLLTKARNAIAQAARTKTASMSAARVKRSAAAKKGWATRLARLVAAAAEDGAKFMPMLTRNGIAWINPVGEDRSLLGSYWVAAGDVLDNIPSLVFDGFDGLSITDSETGQSLPFITDRDTLFSYHDEFDFGPSFYKSRGELPGSAA
jgi:hypothetical protein